jgi:lambda family phage portal protein
VIPRLNFLDRAIGVFDPKSALKRGLARAALDATRGYEGAAIGRRTEGRKAPSSSADSEVISSLVRLRNRSRALHRDNPHARKGKSVWTTHLVRTGIMPRARTGDDQYDADCNGLFDEWSKVCDADGQLDFAGLQELAVGAMVEGGEALIRRRLRQPQDNLPVPLQLQVLEGDLLDHSRFGPVENGQNRIIAGVEFNPIGQRAAYWLFPNHPGNFFIPFGAGNLPNLTSAAVPATEVLHLYRKERTQIRGVPWCHAVINRSYDADETEDAEILRKKLEACIIGIVTGAAEGDEGIAPLGVVDSEGNALEKFEPGMIAYSQGGKDVKFNTPPQGTNYPAYRRLTLHSIAAGYLLPYELMTGDMSEVTFISGRLGLKDFAALVETIQWLCIIPMALQPIWDWFTAVAILSGKLRRPRSGGFRVKCEFDTPVVESANPLDDAMADLIKIRSGTLPLLDAIAATGRNPDEAIAAIARGNALLDTHGIILDSDPRRVSRVGVEQPVSPSSQQQQPPAGNRAPLHAVK